MKVTESYLFPNEETETIRNVFKKKLTGNRYCFTDISKPESGFKNLEENLNLCRWWTSLEINDMRACSFGSFLDGYSIRTCNTENYQGDIKGFGFPVRCVMDYKNQ